MCKYCKLIQKESFSNPDEGDLRIYWIPQIPMDAFYYPVETIKEAQHFLSALGYYDLFQFEHNVKPDFANTGGLEVFEGGEWVEWSDEDGNDIDDYDRNGKLVEHEYFYR